MRRAGRGRPNDATSSQRALIVYGTLARTRAHLSRTGIARLLGLDLGDRDIDRVWDLLISDLDEGGTYLDVAVDNSGKMFCPPESRCPIRPVRLSKLEAIAVQAALAKTGGFDEETLGSVARAWWPEGGTWQLTDGTADTDVSAGADTLLVCALSLFYGRELAFDYVNEQGEATRRHVVPTKLHMSPEWILKAYDLDKQAMRNFRLDRMSKIAPKGKSHTDLNAHSLQDESAPVTLLFSSATWLDLFDWPGLVLDTPARDGYVASGTIPYYGSSFLPAQIAASAGGVTCESAEVMSAARAWAKDLASEAS